MTSPSLPVPTLSLTPSLPRLVQRTCSTSSTSSPRGPRGTRPDLRTAWWFGRFAGALFATLASVCSAQAATSFPDNGGTPSVTLNLSGAVPVLCTFVYTPNANASQLNLVTGQPNGIQVATVNEWCNNRAGFTVIMSSVNKGLVLQGDPAATAYPYLMGYGNVYQPSTGTVSVQRSGPAFDFEVPINMKFDAMQRVVNGKYVDTLSIQVRAN